MDGYLMFHLKRIPTTWLESTFRYAMVGQIVTCSLGLGQLAGDAAQGRFRTIVVAH